MVSASRNSRRRNEDTIAVMFTQADPASRRDFLRTVAGLAGVTALAAADSKPRNIVWIMADDLGYGDVSCLNEGSKIQTPNLDRFAGEGVTCTNAHAPSAVCSPTRYGVMTGRYCFRSPLKNG